MNTDPHTGYLIIADISGYTSYLAKTEIHSAQTLLAELLTRIVDNFKPLVEISRLEGDAVFAYSSAALPLSGETLMALIEATYLAFREGQELYRRTLCSCEACQALPTLELKFVVHYGAYAVQKVGDYRELVGSDVNLAHRLLKNHVTEATGWQAYALLTEAARAQMAVPLAGAHQQTEAYDHLGEVLTHVIDLAPLYQAWLASRRVVVTSEDADLVLHAETDLPPHAVWAYLNDLPQRLKWESLPPSAAGAERPGIGRQNVCVAGGKTFTDVVLDWKPFDYYSVARLVRGGSLKRVGVEALTTFKLHPTPTGGTDLHIYCQVRSPLPPWLARPLAKHILNYMHLQPTYRHLSNLLTEAPPTSP